MSKLDLRDISDRLSRATDLEAVVREFMTYLQATHADWRVALGFYDVGHDAISCVYERQGNKNVRRDLDLPVDQLPPRLVRKFFHPSAFFTGASRGSALSHLFHASPYYECDLTEAAPLKPLMALGWEACVCMPIADRDELLAVLVISSRKKTALTSRSIGEILPLKSMAALALAQHLHRGQAMNAAPTEDHKSRVATAEFQQRIKQLNTKAERLEQDNHAKAEQLASLSREIETLGQTWSQDREELERVKGTLLALEEQNGAAAQHLNDAFTQLTEAQSEVTNVERTVGFMKDVCQVLSQEHDADEFAGMIVEWLCQRFDLERCSLMLVEPDGESLSIAAQHGLDPAVVTAVRVRIGQGVAGWVAHNRKPLLIRGKNDEPQVTGRGGSGYNSDSFVCVPLIYRNAVLGVLNLSNKGDGENFVPGDLDRALIVASVLAVVLCGDREGRRTAA